MIQIFKQLAACDWMIKSVTQKLDDSCDQLGHIIRDRDIHLPTNIKITFNHILLQQCYVHVKPTQEIQNVKIVNICFLNYGYDNTCLDFKRFIK